MTYRPNAESLAGRVIGFFTLNPGEELTLDDIIAKFVDPGDSRNVHTQLMVACDHDMVVYDPEEDVYRKGPVDMPSLISRDPSEPPPPKRPGTWKRAARSSAPSINDDHVGLLADPVAPACGAQDEMDGGGADHAALAVPKQHEARDRRFVEPVARFDRPDGQEIGLDQGPETLALGAGGTTAAAVSIPDGGRGRDGAGHWEAIGSSQGNGLPAGTEAGEQVSATADRNREGDPWRDLPQGEHQSGIPEQLATGERLGGIAGGSRALPLAGQDRAGGEELGQPVDNSPMGVVRNHLLNTLADLRNPDKPMALDRARVVAEVSRELISSAKVEVEYLKVTQQRRGAFFTGLLPTQGGDA